MCLHLNLQRQGQVSLYRLDISLLHMLSLHSGYVFSSSHKKYAWTIGFPVSSMSRH
jgi:hypothetical protein